MGSPARGPVKSTAENALNISSAKTPPILHGLGAAYGRFVRVASGALVAVLLGACAPLNQPSTATKAERITITKDGPIAEATEKRVKEGAASTLASAKAYASKVNAATLKAANAYTDSKLAEVEQGLKSDVVVPKVVTVSAGRVFALTYEVPKLKEGSGKGEYQAIRVMPFDARITTGSVSESSWATGVGGAANAGFIITRIRDGKQFMVMSSSSVAQGTYRPVITEEVDLKAGDQIGIEQVSGAAPTNVIINLYFSKQ